MQNKTILSLAFGLMVLMQWFVPSKMIWDREDILINGNEYLLECQPIDPNDPFRGKYITLGFKEDRIKIPDDVEYNSGEWIYTKLENDDRGFAKIQSISREEPEEMKGILKASAGWAIGDKEDNDRTLSIKYPFDRFYMEESKAKPAEDLYRKSARDTSTTTYAVVMIKDGVGVIKDVMIDGVSIGTVVENEIKRNQY